ncbi:MAG: cell division protein ZapA [bacterium]|nr:cell division protein ZapA [bacterium]
MEKLEILGKKYKIQSDIASEEIIKMHSEIVKRLKDLSSEYPTLDKIDILVLYVIELKKEIIDKEKQIQKGKNKLESISKKISLIEEKIKENIKNLDRFRKVL